MTTTFHTIPALAGEDVSRKIDPALEIEYRDGRLYDPELRLEWIASEGETLMGWGNLDGPSTLLTMVETGQTINVRPADLERIRAAHCGA